MTEPRRPLTEMQSVVAERIGRGLSYADCAKSIGIATNTVRCHVAAIALKIPNPNGLPPKMLVALWAARHAA
jgi:DNA-binding NarL/FixJ family response regulator